MAKPSAPTWPTGARCAVFFSVDLDGTALEKGEGVEPLGIYSYGVYAYRCAVPRYLRLFDRHGIRVTFFVPGFDGEVAPDTIKTIAAHGHEVAAHGYRHESEYLEGEAEWELLRRTHDILTNIVGAPPHGWRNPGGMKSRFTTGYLRTLGYIYDSSDKDFERPYRIEDGCQATAPMVELPTNTASLDDAYLNSVAMLAPSQILELWKAEFDATYRSDGYFALILHGRAWWGSGTPSRVRVLDQLIRYISAHEGIVYVRGMDLAQWCLANPVVDTMGTRDSWLYKEKGGL